LAWEHFPSLSVPEIAGGNVQSSSRTGTGYRCLSGRLRFNLLELGFRQSSLNLATRVLQDSSRDTFDPLLLSSHAVFPSAFRLRVGLVALVVLGRNNPAPYTVNGRPLSVHLNGLAIVLLK